MTLPSSGALDMSAINAEYGLGTDLGAYVGARWYTPDAVTGMFTSPIDIGQFYGTSATSPVAPDSQIFTSSGTFIVPLYAVLTVTLYGGAGGGGGGGGNVSGGYSGNPGGDSSFEDYGSGQHGGGGGANGGTPGAAGANSTGSPAGGGGGSGHFGAGGADGGAGGQTILTLTNQLSGGTGPLQGSSVYVTVGAGGSGGGGGTWYLYPFAGNAGSGGYGEAGYVIVEWS